LMTGLSSVIIFMLSLSKALVFHLVGEQAFSLKDGRNIPLFI